MDDWDWSYSDWSTPSYSSDWSTSYDWSTPSWDVPSYSDWSAPSYDWSIPSFSYDDYSSDPWDSVTISDWSTPSYDSGYWSDYLPSYEPSYDWSTPSYEDAYTPVSYDTAEPFTWSDIQTPDTYAYTDSTTADMDSALRNIDIAEGVGQLTPYQAEEARLGVQQDEARKSALEELQAQASQELSSVQDQEAARQARMAEMQAQAGDELAAAEADRMRQERMAEYQKQASSELDAVRAQLARDAVKSAMGTVSDVVNPKSSGTSQAQQSILEQLAKTLGATGLKQAQAAARYQASPIAGVANTAQSVLQILKALKGENNMPTQARSSTVQNIGPTAQGARGVRTLYAKGGKVHEVPVDVMGGLLPIALKMAEHLMSGNRHEGLIQGEEGGQDDVVDIKAAPGEYIIDAEIVSALGDGNNENGARKLDKMRYNIRKHKRSGGLAQIAPKAKAVSDYMKG